MKLGSLIGKEVFDKDSIKIGRVSSLVLDPTLSLVERIFVKRGFFGPENWFKPEHIDHTDDIIVLKLTDFQITALVAYYETMKIFILKWLKGSMTEQALFDDIKGEFGGDRSRGDFEFAFHQLLNEGKIVKYGNEYRRK